MVVSTILAEWFTNGNELYFAFGLNLSVARLGCVINNWVSPWVGHEYGLLYVGIFGVILCCLLVLCVLLVIPIDKAVSVIVKRAVNHQTAIDNDPLYADNIVIDGGNVRRVNTLGTEIGGSKQQLDDMEREDIGFNAVWKFPEIFWLLCLSCLLVYGTLW